MPYNFITLAQLRSQLASRLDDPFNIFWGVTELNAYINEALQTFSAFSGFYRNRGTFNTNPGSVFYDLPTNLASICGYNVQDITLIPVMCYQLIEPVPTNLGTASAAWIGTDMFTLAELTQALQNRRDQFLADTGCVVTNFVQSMPAPPIGRVSFPDNVMDIRRLQWLSQIGTASGYGMGLYGLGPYGGPTPTIQYTNLWPLTEMQLTMLNQSWSVNPSVPYGYSIISSPPLTIQVGPVPATEASIDVVAVEAGAALNPQVGVLMGIPDDFTWIVKWGALADLLGMDGQARDPQRAAFCEQRYQLGVQLARMAPLALQAIVNGVPQVIGSIAGLDALNPGWQGGLPGTTQSVVSVGRNMVAANPPPLTNLSSLTFDVVANATLPTNDGSYIQVGREQVASLIDYAEHLACFKMGGTEFAITERQATNFMRQAAVYNERLSAASLFSSPTGDQGLMQDIRMQRRTSGKALSNA